MSVLAAKCTRRKSYLNSGQNIETPRENEAVTGMHKQPPFLKDQ